MNERISASIRRQVQNVGNLSSPVNDRQRDFIRLCGYVQALEDAEIISSDERQRFVEQACDALILDLSAGS
ncbi:hypothetical protein GCM10007421_22350 [Halopseudomonas oceani]|uniref:Uncharacterized protein n=1 Tax=Halopseudomonas oceani TaxID=1708783 RepID=A0A2P4ET07_9GAMM|nr:hypothetical protein [Halopseudomonas oceani]POB02414.1 hypothetical protein C1949_13285 [Halopseudomonas oceani]GGE47629.1 hypothetical protein GCM10007421_22350 [Halopseudomonas oceani]